MVFHMVEIRVIKREIESLPDISEQLTSFKDAWFAHPHKKKAKGKKRAKKNALHQIFDGLEQKQQEELSQKLVAFYSTFDKLEAASFTTQKLRTLSSALVEMKLGEFRNSQRLEGQSMLETKRSEFLQNKVLNDDFHGLSTVIREVKNFHSNLEMLEVQYEEINDLLYKQLILEYSLKAMDTPHKKRLHNIKKASHKRKELVRVMGRAFIDMQKMRKKPLKA